ncbi:MAG: DNRLRE domain-containing protein, partial [Flavobacteriales bacterium]|nr:DNRLRE domain-containing protein [Flavobacteriales bacterium]
PSLAAVAWTNSGGPSNIRSLLAFDLDTLPVGAQILDARLSLYHDPTSSEGEHSSLSGPNNCSIRRVLQAWDEMTVTWDSQPGSTPQNEVVLPPSTSNTQDYLDIDVTDLVVDMIQYGGHGFLLRMETESYYRRVVFASSDHSDEDLHPKLVITHQGGVGIEEASHDALRIHPNPTKGQVLIDGLEADAQVEVFDLLGNRLTTMRPPAAGRTAVDLSDRPQGVYLVRVVEGSGRSSVQRVLLQ